MIFLSRLPSFGHNFSRVVTGSILTAALAACLVLGGSYLAAAIALVSGIALYEFFQMFWPGGTKIATKIFGILLGLLLLCPATLPFSTVTGKSPDGVFLAMGCMWAGVAFLWDFGRGDGEACLGDYALLPFALLYIPVTLKLALSLSLNEQILIVGCAIASDTAAFYFGTAFGKHKIWPAVSPKKSVEGSVAGFLASVFTALVISSIPYGAGPLRDGNIILNLAIGACLSLASQFGDFFESAMKRRCNIKDSGHILPGHGGMLDRIDSILFSFVMYWFISCVIHLVPPA
ncbi:phosphatidate cytidylyltransferase [Deltaproteobacteria bacterium]|nr:phosphatidate cytidylyltransferase [Deltaproteobacteria bacterium]